MEGNYKNIDNEVFNNYLVNGISEPFGDNEILLINDRLDMKLTNRTYYHYSSNLDRNGKKFFILDNSSMSRRKVFITIYKLVDEWYMVNIYRSGNILPGMGYKIYHENFICDQLDGLVDCIKDSVSEASLMFKN